MKFRSLLPLLFLLALAACGPNDEKIGAAVTAALSANSGLSTVASSVKEGVVTLTGEVETEELKALAASALEGIKGIKSVANNLTVKPKGPSPEELKKMADTALQTLVNEAFTKYGVSGITASVMDSVVTLTGDIKRSELPNAMKAAMEVAPKKVENQMTIKK